MSDDVKVAEADRKLLEALEPYAFHDKSDQGAITDDALPIIARHRHQATADLQAQLDVAVKAAAAVSRERDDLQAQLDEARAEVEAVKRVAIDTICTAELPRERQSCGRDDSGVALTLQRQRSWTLDAVKSAFDNLTGDAT